jgi:hypothetical protein
VAADQVDDRRIAFWRMARDVWHNDEVRRSTDDGVIVGA